MLGGLDWDLIRADPAAVAYGGSGQQEGVCLRTAPTDSGDGIAPVHSAGSLE